MESAHADTTPDCTIMGMEHINMTSEHADFSPVYSDSPLVAAKP
jgi:hypothetical protein